MRSECDEHNEGGVENFEFSSDYSDDEFSDEDEKKPAKPKPRGHHV